MKDVVTVIMGGGKGTRLFPLTRHRAKPAVPVAGRARLIDLALSNCINSGLTRIFVLTQFNSASLNRHINRTYHFGSLLPGGVEVLSAELTPEHQGWFQGTADAVRHNLHHMLDRSARWVVILAGDHLYQMDYAPFLRRHQESGADVTISVSPIGPENASSFGLLHCDDEGFVTRFAEKPTGEALEAMRVDPDVPLIGGDPPGEPYLASMGIYVFDREALVDLLRSHPEQHDFGKELIPEALKTYRVGVHCFRGYWEDIGTISAFYRANLALTRPGQYSLYNPRSPLYTRPRYLSPTRLGKADIERALIAEGSVIGPCRIRDSVVGIRSRVEDGVTLEGTLVMGNDEYETEEDRSACRERGLPPLGIGARSIVRRAILDKGARIGTDVRIVNEAGVEHHDDDLYYIREGIVIIPRSGVIPNGTVI